MKSDVDQIVKSNIRSKSRLQKHRSEAELKKKYEKLKIGEKLDKFNKDVREKNSRSRSRSKNSPGSPVETRCKPQKSKPLVQKENR